MWSVCHELAPNGWRRVDVAIDWISGDSEDGIDPWLAPAWASWTDAVGASRRFDFKGSADFDDFWMAFCRSFITVDIDWTREEE